MVFGVIMGVGGFTGLGRGYVVGFMGTLEVDAFPFFEGEEPFVGWWGVWRLCLDCNCGVCGIVGLG